MTDAIHLSNGASLATLGTGVLAALAALVWLLRKSGRETLAPVWLLLSSLVPLVVGLLAAARDVEQLDPVIVANQADFTAWPANVSRALATVHARLALGQGTSAAAMALVLLAVMVAGRRTADTPARTGHHLAAGAALLALAGGVAAYASLLRADAHYHLPGTDWALRRGLLVATASALEPLLTVRAALTLLALAFAVALVLRGPASTSSLAGRAGHAFALVGLLAIQLGDLGVTYWASRSALVTLRPPWAGQALQPMTWPSHIDEAAPSAAAWPRLILGANGLVDLDMRRTLDPDRPAWVTALQALQRRIRAEEVAWHPAPIGSYGARATWDGCDPPVDGDRLTFVADQHASTDALRQLVSAASEVGFGTLEMVGPITPPESLRALGARGSVGAALLAHPMYGLEFTLPPRCVAGSATFLSGTVGSDVPSALDHSSGSRFPLTRGGPLTRYRARMHADPEVVLALGPQVTLSALTRTHVLISTVAGQALTPRLVASPAALPGAQDVPP